MDPEFVCELCFNKYKTQKNKDKHICKIKDTRINCKTCNKSFTRLIYKTKHEIKCQNTPPPNNYGYEVLDYITDNDIIDMISKGCEGVIKMILMKHFNKVRPENHNIIMNGEDCYVYRNDEWKKISREALITDLYYDGINSIDVIYEEFVDNNTPLKVKDKDIDFLKYDYEDGTTMETNKEKINEILENNKNVKKISNLKYNLL